MADASDIAGGVIRGARSLGGLPFIGPAAGAIGMLPEPPKRNPVVGVDEVAPNTYQVQYADGKKTNMTGDRGRQEFDRYVGSLPARPKDESGVRAGTSEAAPAPQQAAPTQSGGPPQTQGNYALPHAGEGIDPVTGKKVQGQLVMQDGQLMVRIPGSKGSPGGVTALGNQILSDKAAANAAATPLEREAADAVKLESIRQQQDVANQQAFVADQQIRAVIDQQNQEQEALEADKHVADLQARADAAMNEYTSSRPPERSTEESILSGVAAGLGALGAALARTPNFAESFLNQLAANKMRKWEAEVALKGKKADNLLARYTAALGDSKLAKAAVKETILKQAALEQEQAALATGSDKIRNTHQQMSNAAAAAAIRAGQEKQEGFLKDFYGNKLLYRQGTAGSAPRLGLATAETYGKVQDDSLAVEANRRADEKAAADKAESGGGADKESVARISEVVAASNVAGLANRILKNPALAGNDEWFEPSGSMTPGPLRTKEEHQLRQDLQSYINFRIKEMTGAGLSEQEAKRLAAAEVGNGSSNAIRRGVEGGRKAAIEKVRSHLSVSAPGRQKQFLDPMDPEVRKLVEGK